MKSENLTYPERFTPATLSINYPNLVFCIPIYQRLFVWDKKQVEKLMSDLFDAFTNNKPSYYLGILTVAGADGKLDLIDGQQRMTVTILMAIAFMELDSGANQYWDGYVSHGKRLEFSARLEDSSYISTRAISQTTGYTNSMMESGINRIKDWCKNTFKTADGGFDCDRFDRFARYVWDRLTLFCSRLPDKYISNPVELNRYFEAMNSTGRQLQQHEILLVELVTGHPKSEIFSKLWSKIGDVNRRFIPSVEERNEYRNLYRQKIVDTQSLFEETADNDNDYYSVETIEQIKPMKKESHRSTSESASKQMIISFEALLLMALRLTTKGDHSRDFYKTDLLLPRFSKAGLKDSGRVDEFFMNLLKCRLILDYKIIWQETDGNFDYDLVTEDRDKKLEKFQSMLHVSNPDQFYRWLPEYMEWLLDNPCSTEEEEMKRLEEIDKSLHPTLPEVEALCYPGIDRYWFWRLDYELWKDCTSNDGWLKDYPELKDAAKRYVFRANRSIEHLHPQTRTDEKSEDWVGYDLNRFGNLAMISSSFNSLQSNEAAGVKMERIHHQIETSQLQSLKMLHMWIMYKEQTDTSQAETWTKEKADQHEKFILPYLMNLFREEESQPAWRVSH